MKRSSLERKTGLRRSKQWPDSFMSSATGWQPMDAAASQPHSLASPYSKKKRKAKAKARAKIANGKRAQVAARQGWRCVACGSTLPAWFDTHHVLPQGKWPEHAHERDNLVAIDRGCHDNHERAHRRIRYDELPQQVREWIGTLGEPEKMYAERTYGAKWPARQERE
jgi:hypothetical protein